MKKAKTKRKYCLGVNGHTFRYDNIKDRRGAVKIAKAIGRTAVSTWHEDVPVKPKAKKKPANGYVKPCISDCHHRFEQSVLRVSEGGMGIADVKRSFKANPIDGVRFETVGSSYLGHATYRIYATTKKALHTALQRLVKLGYVKSIKEASYNIW